MRITASIIATVNAFVISLLCTQADAFTFTFSFNTPSLPFPNTRTSSSLPYASSSSSNTRSNRPSPFTNNNNADVFDDDDDDNNTDKNKGKRKFGTSSKKRKTRNPTPARLPLLKKIRVVDSGNLSSGVKGDEAWRKKYANKTSTSTSSTQIGIGVDDDPVISQPSSFYSAKSLESFVPLSSPIHAQFNMLCKASGLSKPSKIQALAWPFLLSSLTPLPLNKDNDKNKDNAEAETVVPEPVIIAEQTGGGKTLAYLLPALLQNLLSTSTSPSSSPSPSPSPSPSIPNKNTKPPLKASKPKLLILCPTGELSSQVGTVCKQIASNLGPTSRFRSLVVSANTENRMHIVPGNSTIARVNNIREQVRMLRVNDVNVLIGTPGRIAQLLQAKPCAVDLSDVVNVVLDECDVLINSDDVTFTSQIQSIGKMCPMGTRFVFVTATLPDAVVRSIESEFASSPSKKVQVFKGPGLHKSPKTVTEYIIDCTLPPSDTSNEKLGFEKKTEMLLLQLSKFKCKRTLIFCNSLESCRSLENFLSRRDRKGNFYNVLSYHSALTPSVRDGNLKSFCFTSRSDQDQELDQILISTDRASRGQDFNGKSVDHVVIYDFPINPAEYVRRVGRTGRAGKEGVVSVLAYGWQVGVARGMVSGNGNGNGDGDEREKEKKKQEKKKSAKELIEGNELWKTKKEIQLDEHGHGHG